MLLLNAAEISALAPLPGVIDCLHRAFSGWYETPPRHVINMPGGAGDRLLLTMSAFDCKGAGAVKLASVVPENRAQGLPTIQAVIVVFSQTGTPIALLDGTTVTRLRTAAASALASRYLSRANSSQLVIVGTGALAPMMAAAHCVVRPIARVSVWGRHQEHAVATAATIRTLVTERVEVVVAESIEAAVRTADIVSCATASSAPVLAGKWLRPGAFVDLVGSFSPRKREADDDVILRSRIFVDTFEGAWAEAGDLLDPIARGIIDRQRIEGELADLVRERTTGRTNEHEITLFKSVGTAIEDLATSRLIVDAAGRDGRFGKCTAIDRTVIPGP